MGVLLVVEESTEQLSQGGKPLPFVLQIERYQLRRPQLDGWSAIGTPQPAGIADPT